MHNYSKRGAQQCGACKQFYHPVTNHERHSIYSRSPCPYCECEAIRVPADLEKLLHEDTKIARSGVMREDSNEGYKCETCNRIYGPVCPEDQCPYCELAKDKEEGDKLLLEVDARLYRRGKEIERLRSALREVQWRMRMCVGCGVVWHGSLSTPLHEDDCIIEVALKPK